MKRTRVSVLLAGALLAAAVTATLTAPAQAQNNRSWVSNGGLDTNPCSAASPCKTFNGAIAKTNAGGEINCLDSGGFGGVTINISVTISCEGVTAGIQVSGTNNGVNVSVSSTDTVYLRGLDIESPDPASPALSGISFTGGGTLHVEKCLIRGFTNVSGGWGIFFSPSQQAALFVSDTVISENGNPGEISGGILLDPLAAVLVNASLERVQLLNNVGGIRADGTTATSLQVDVNDSRASGNLNNGFFAFTKGGTTLMLIKHSVATNNAGSGARASGTNAEIFIGDSMLTGNGFGVSTASGGTVLSYQNNQIDANATNGTPTPDTLR